MVFAIKNSRSFLSRPHFHPKSISKMMLHAPIFVSLSFYSWVSVCCKDARV